MLKVYSCLLGEELPEIPSGLLSAYREEKLSAQKALHARRLSLYSELLLRYAMKDSGYAPDTPLKITAGEYGKPRLRGGEIYFNLSHSGDALLCALSDSEIGADAQLLTQAKLPLMKRFFAEDEQSFVLSAADADEAFTEIWTMKESFCKLSGKGLTLPLPSFSVLDDEIAPLLWYRKKGEYHFAVCGEAVRDGQIDWIEVKTGLLL